ncbi:MAG: 2-isopropylmalate synthase [Bacteroidetes bacterium]|nr:2-isopropylmalate synthase [Bacteroidota bacterium]MCH8523278.1 2-isopropylmalate synthase [Balneolales bacterium]
MNKHIQIFDTTLRDGEQSPGFSMTHSEKLRMAEQLEILGVDVIEAGFPIASDGDFEAVKAISKRITNCQVAGLCRIKHDDICRAWEALQFAEKPRIHTFVATSDIHLVHKLNMSREQVIEAAISGVTFARSLCDVVEFSAEDASRTDPDFLCQILEAVIEAGATIVNIPDTVGFAVPDEFGSLIRKIKTEVPNISKATISVHCHNDLGLGVANSLAAIQNGAKQIECTINGIGERAGNASLEEIVMALAVRKSFYGSETKVNTAQLYPSSQLLAEITGNQVQPNKAIVGKNAFAHEAGIHQDGVLKNPLTYEIMTPQTVGVPQNSLVLGKHSGRRALGDRLDKLGFTFSKDEVNKIYQCFTVLADLKKTITDEDLIYLSKTGIDLAEKPDIAENLQEYINQ